MRVCVPVVCLCVCVCVCVPASGVSVCANVCERDRLSGPTTCFHIWQLRTHTHRLVVRGLQQIGMPKKRAKCVAKYCAGVCVYVSVCVSVVCVCE